jgi:hypothetical protein
MRRHKVGNVVAQIIREWEELRALASPALLEEEK